MPKSKSKSKSKIKRPFFVEKEGFRLADVQDVTPSYIETHLHELQLMSRSVFGDEWLLDANLNFINVLMAAHKILDLDPETTKSEVWGGYLIDGIVHSIIQIVNRDGDRKVLGKIKIPSAHMNE
jgi:hypothetical protein